MDITMFLVNDYDDNYVDGWVKLFRSLKRKGWYKKSAYVHLWIHLLIKANHKGKEFFFAGRNIKLNPGQFVTGRKVLAMETGINESKIERILNFFEKNEHQIEQQKTNKNRIITIIGWNLYQQSEQQVNNKRTTSEQQVNTNKNDKNVKNEKNNIYIPAQQKKITQNFQKMINENYPNIAKMERQITDSELDNLLKRYKPEDIKATLSEMDNWKPLVKKNISVGRTLENWLRRSYGYRTKEAVSA